MGLKECDANHKRLTNITAKNLNDLRNLIFVKNIDVLLIDTQLITDMSNLFSGKSKHAHKCLIFNKPLNIWDVSNVKTMQGMFYNASYATSSDAIFRAEATAFVEWCDHCWRTCYNILGEFQSGEIEMPTVEYVLNQLPVLDWASIQV